MLRPASGTSQQSQVAAKTPAGMSRANRSTSFRRLSRLKLAPRKTRSVRRQSRPGTEESLARRRRQCLRASGGAHCRVAREREVVERVRKNRKRLGEKSQRASFPAVKTPTHEPTQARIVSVCRLRRNQAGRAMSFAQIGCLLRPAMDGCHCFVTAERGCEVNELGSLWTPPPITRDQRAVAAATIEARRGRAGMVGGGGLRRRGSLAAPDPRWPRGQPGKERLFFYEHTPPYPKAARKTRGRVTAGKKRCRLSGSRCRCCGAGSETLRPSRQLFAVGVGAAWKPPRRPPVVCL